MFARQINRSGRLRPSKESGFTLVEVLAALLIFSIAIIGLTRAATESTRTVSFIEEKMLAGIVADNQLVLSKNAVLKKGVISGRASILSQEFEYDVTTVSTDTPNFYRVKVGVRRQGQERVVVERTAFRRGVS